MSTSLPLDWPPLREAAEAMADELETRLIAVAVELYGSDRYKIGGPHPILTATHRALLADLGRPDSRLTWVFWMQQRQANPPAGWTWWDIVQDADSAAALRAALLAVVPHAE